MPPVHVLPLRTVRVPLVIEVPYAILIKHTIGIVHPPVYRRMMIDRTETLAVGCVKRIGIFDVFPTDELAYGTFLAAIATKLNIQQTGALQLVGNIIVHPINGQLHIQPLHHLVVVVQYCNGGNVFRLLHGQEYVLLTLFHFHHGVAVAQYHWLHLRLS